jgi:hypothetical protein
MTTIKEDREEARKRLSDHLFEQLVESISASWAENSDNMMRQLESSGKLKVSIGTSVADDEQSTSFRWEEKKQLGEVTVTSTYSLPAVKHTVEDIRQPMLPSITDPV